MSWATPALSFCSDAIEITLNLDGLVVKQLAQRGLLGHAFGVRLTHHQPSFVQGEDESREQHNDAGLVGEIEQQGDIIHVTRTRTAAG